jgi:hypothetical protein
MTVLAITITDPSPAFEHKSSEVAFLQRVLQVLQTEIGRGVGTVTSGSIRGTSAGGTPNTSLGSWTYSPAATKP